jgi:predicted Zn-ribbon and HTH transcriptional regulator
MSLRKRVDFKIREEDAAVLREVAAALNVKLADIVKLWPRCPQCGFKVVEVAGRLACPKCNSLYKLVKT